MFTRTGSLFAYTGSVLLLCSVFLHCSATFTNISLWSCKENGFVNWLKHEDKAYTTGNVLEGPLADFTEDKCLMKCYGSTPPCNAFLFTGSSSGSTSGSCTTLGISVGGATITLTDQAGTVFTARDVDVCDDHSCPAACSPNPPLSYTCA